MTSPSVQPLPQCVDAADDDFSVRLAGLQLGAAFFVVDSSGGGLARFHLLRVYRVLRRPTTHRKYAQIATGPK